ncbi:uncharacterized protein O3C94_015160 isoform 3-T3 [Discoglossus pictus]
MRLIQVCVLVLLYADPGPCGQNIKPICPASIGENITMICEYDLEKCKKNCQTNQGCRLDWCKKNPQHCWNPENLKQTTGSNSGISIQDSTQKGQFNLTITQIKDKDFGLYSCRLCNKVLTRINLKKQPVTFANGKSTCRPDKDGESIGNDDTEENYGKTDSKENKTNVEVSTVSYSTNHEANKGNYSSPSGGSNYLSILLPCLAAVILLLLAVTFILIRIHKKMKALRTRDPTVGGSPGQNIITVYATAKNPEDPEKPTITMNPTNIYEEIPSSPVVITEIMENPLYSTSDSTENPLGTTGGQNSGDGQYSLLGPSRHKT